MLRWLGLLALLLVAGVGALFAFAAGRPDTFRVARSISIKASPDRIFPLIADLRAFNTWNPFVTGDPDIALVYSGPRAGPGAVVAFGPGKGGSGTVSIAQTAPPTKVVMRLDMTRPLEAHNGIEFTLVPEGETTRVAWAMHGGVPLVGKVLHLFVDMDKMIGGQFDKGLADLKALAEK